MQEILVSLSRQHLCYIDEAGLQRTYLVSTAIKGAGNYKNSGCTPIGEHKIRAKIGAGLPLNAVLVARRFTGEIYSQSLAHQYPQRDWILTRILWLSGLQQGLNRGGQVDTMQRYIYIHGTPDTEPMGEPKSHGCIRMRNTDLVELFDVIAIGCRVTINMD